MKRHYFTQRQQTRRFLTGALLSLSVLATGGPAAAVDGKTYPGSACEPSTLSQPFFKDTLGRIFNPSTQTLSVTCAIVRDTIGGNSTAGIDQVLVQVIDQHPNQAVGCTINSVQNTGQVVETDTRFSSGSSPNVQQLQPPFTDLASTSSGYYTLFCNIPPMSGNLRSGIVMYRVDEND